MPFGKKETFIHIHSFLFHLSRRRKKVIMSHWIWLDLTWLIVVCQQRKIEMVECRHVMSMSKEANIKWHSEIFIQYSPKILANTSKCQVAVVSQWQVNEYNKMKGKGKWMMMMMTHEMLCFRRKTHSYHKLTQTKGKDKKEQSSKWCGSTHCVIFTYFTYALIGIQSDMQAIGPMV